MPKNLQSFLQYNGPHQDSIPGRSGIESLWEDEILRTHPNPTWGPPSLLYKGWVFSSRNAAGAWRRPPTPTRVEVKERVELYLYSFSGPSCVVLG